jgi:hypothetical protein
MGLERFDLAAIEARVLDAPPGGLRDDALALITEVRRLRRVVESGAAEPVEPAELDARARWQAEMEAVRERLRASNRGPSVH